MSRPNFLFIVFVSVTSAGAVACTKQSPARAKVGAKKVAMAQPDPRSHAADRPAKNEFAKDVKKRDQSVRAKSASQAPSEGKPGRLESLKKSVNLSMKQKELRKHTKEQADKAEDGLDGALDEAKRSENKRKGAGSSVGKVAPSGDFPEEAHNRYERLCEQIEEMDGVMASFRKSKSKKLWIRAKSTVVDCLTTAEEMAEEYKGYPGIDDRVAELEKKEQTLNAEKP
jgi:hypothetical protein